MTSRGALCISTVLRGYIEKPEEQSDGVRRNGEGTISLNNEADIVGALLEYLKHEYVGNEFTGWTGDERGPTFTIRLYKLALSLGYAPT
jgi:hypothetical protein